MEFFDKAQDFMKSAGDKIQEIVKSVSDKTSDEIEISKLKRSISEEKRAISEQIARLGEIYYEQYKAGVEMTPEAANICMVIDKHNEKIEESKAQIQKINTEKAERAAERREAQNASAGENGVECPECHMWSPEGTRFCTNCGAKIPEVVEAEAVEVEEAAEPVSNAKKFCPDCGTEIGEGKKFCGECGRKVE